MIKKLLITLGFLYSVAYAQTEWIYRQNYYSFDVGLRGSFLIDRYGYNVLGFPTITTGIEVKDMIWAKGFIGLNKEPYVGGEFSYNTGHSIEGPIDVIIGTQVGYYRKEWGIGYPHLQTRYKFNDFATTSLIVAPDRLEIRIGIINTFTK